MARQSTSPVQFSKSKRRDVRERMSSGRAGVVTLIDCIGVHRGDSASGRINVMADLADMPKPLMNRVGCQLQAWYVPASAHPRFTDYNEFLHAVHGETVKSLAGDRQPPPFLESIEGGDVVTVKGSEMFRTLGIHVPAGRKINTSLIDAFWIVYNFRLAAHSSRLERRKYASEDLASSVKFPPAFWPANSMAGIVPDYEQALVVGSLNLDITAGQLPISGLMGGSVESRSVVQLDEDGLAHSPGTDSVRALYAGGASNAWDPIFAELGGKSILTTLADIDKARVSQAFAKLHSAYAGNDTTGFNNEDALVADLMQGFTVPEDLFKRPWLLDSKTVDIAMLERHATDGANLDASVSNGAGSGSLSINLPKQDSGGWIIVTMEVLPERIFEGRSDEFILATEASDFPDALRDIQRPEPVDMVPNHRVDARHTSPEALYGYEPMNMKWQINGTNLGGVFFQASPSDGYNENRSSIWTPQIVDPEFTEDHYLAPVPFPHDVFSDTQAPAFEYVVQHDVVLSGITQFGDVLVENNSDYAETLTQEGTE